MPNLNINGAFIKPGCIKSVRMYVSIVKYVNTPNGDTNNNMTNNAARHIVNFMRQVYLCEHPSDELDLLDGKFTDAQVVVNTVSLRKYDSLHQFVALSIDFDNMLSLGYINYSEYKNNTLHMTHSQQLFIENKQNNLIKRHRLTDYMLTSSTVDESMMLIQKPEKNTLPTKTVRQYDKAGNYIDEYDNVSDAARKTGINRTNISKCCAHRQASAGGFIFRFSDDTSNQVGS